VTRSTVQNAELALLLEVAGTPKPGNVDRHRDLDGLRFEHYLAGSVGARPGLAAAANGDPLGAAFEHAVDGMSAQRGGNTQFGALLLLVPLAAAAGANRLTSAGAEAVVADTTVEDAADFYRAFEHVDVFVDDPPEGADALDVRRGTEAVSAVREHGLSLLDVLALGDDEDDDAREWTHGFPRSFRAADRIAALDGSVPDRAARAFLEALAQRPDTLVAKQHGQERADAVSDRAADLLDADRDAIEAFADDLVSEGVNPGTTADIIAAGLFIALERDGVDV
jgi:triphosphoribosyl-dephospho-CoA synthase